MPDKDTISVEEFAEQYPYKGISSVTRDGDRVKIVFSIGDGQEMTLSVPDTEYEAFLERLVDTDLGAYAIDIKEAETGRSSRPKLSK